MEQQNDQQKVQQTRQPEKPTTEIQRISDNLEN